MSLSQRYSGKVLTPWFDSAEWIETKKRIYSDCIESQQLALRQLKIWKLRTPLLSIGIEGTLILLEALLEKHRNLTDYETAQIFSTALLRFLNICAASNDRQGTFYKTAEKNDLPYWLITLRHDIAHDHKIPSKAILECALNECFKWIKQKYWDVQELHIKDYTVSYETNYMELIEEYVQLNLRYFFKENIGNRIFKIKNKFRNILDECSDKLNPNDFISFLEDFIFQTISEDKVKDSSIYIVSSLVDEDIILSINSCLIDDTRRIPPDFLHIWNKIINFLFRNGTIFLLINKLAEVTASTIHEHSAKEIASLWITELYHGFFNARKMKDDFKSLKSPHPEELHFRTGHLLLELMYEDDQVQHTITFEDFEKLLIEDSKSFQEKMLKKPNEFTLSYVELMLKFNGCSSDFIKEQIKSIKKLVKLNTIYYTDSDIIHTVKELQELYQNGNHFTEIGYFTKDRTNGVGVKNKFRKLTGAEKFRFKGYPLGLLPPEIS